jgi:hypothetical protein
MLSLAYLRRVLAGLRTQHLQQAVGELGRLQNGVHQHQASARIFMLGHVQQSPAHGRIIAEAFCALDQPQVERVFLRANVRQQLSVETLRIIYQISRMYFEKIRQ